MVTTTTGNAIDWARVRDDFPILASDNERGQRLAFLDSAASSQKPEQVITAVDRYYRATNANIHRGVYDLSERATAQYEAARHMVADFVNSESAREIVFVRNTTEAINLVAQTWGRRNVRAGDLIVVTTMRSPALTLRRPQVCATRLIASVVFLTKTISRADPQLTKSATMCRAASYCAVARSDRS